MGDDRAKIGRGGGSGVRRLADRLGAVRRLHRVWLAWGRGAIRPPQRSVRWLQRPDRGPGGCRFARCPLPGRSACGRYRTVSGGHLSDSRGCSAEVPQTSVYVDASYMRWRRIPYGILDHDEPGSPVVTMEALCDALWRDRHLFYRHPFFGQVCSPTAGFRRSDGSVPMPGHGHRTVKSTFDDIGRFILHSNVEASIRAHPMFVHGLSLEEGRRGGMVRCDEKATLPQKKTRFAILLP